MSHRARKRFGQNFLVDSSVVEDIVNAVAPQPGQRLVEIGPGTGALSSRLLAAAGELHVIEIDRDLVADLQRRYAGQSVHVHQADALKFDFRELAHQLGGPLRIVGNLPYNISTPLLFHLMAATDCIADMHFMLQKEVVARIAAVPGNKQYGKLSLMVQARCAVTPLFDVPPSAFAPPPEVNSSVFRCVPYPQALVAAEDFERFTRVVTAAFAQRRKTLHNNFKGLLTDAHLQAAGIAPSQRAEELSLADYARLAQLLS